MTLPTEPLLPYLPAGATQYEAQLNRRLTDLFRAVAVEVNASGSPLTGTEAPASGTYAQGDYVLNTAPTELGETGAKYVVAGWRCIVAGSPGTWVEDRILTGN